MSNYIYNFPISMLQGFMINSDSVMSKILDFVLFSTCKDQEELDMESAADRMGVSFGNLMGAYAEGESLYNSYSDEGYPWTGMSHDLFWKFYKKDRSDLDKATLLAFLAIKSLIGQKPYYKVTNQDVIFKRMAGHKEKDKFYLPKEIKNFTTRSRFNRIKLELKEHWNVVIYANHVRGMYISTTMSLEELAFHAEKNKLKTRQKLQSNAAEEARKKAIELLAVGSQQPQQAPRKDQPLKKPRSNAYEGIGYNPESIPF